MPPSTPTTPTRAPQSDVSARALAWLKTQGLSQSEAEALLAVYAPSEEGAGEIEAVFLSTPRPSASR